jgi:predicted glycoside hydrolase/deacetylase ChbG (UPF0249 family)
MTGGASRRRLIVNADDFGQSEGVTEGILRAHEHGIVTSTSLMVRWPGAADAVSRASKHPSLSVGLHVDLGEWRKTDDGWEAAYKVVDTDDAAAVEREITSQCARFEALCGKPPTHLDSHQHVHLKGHTRSVMVDIGARFRIPVRHFSRATYAGTFYGQTAKGQPLPDLVTVPALVATLEQLPEGVTELCCHPSAREDFESTYSAERLVELATLCDPQVRAALEKAGIQLINFADPLFRQPVKHGGVFVPRTP